MIGAAHKICPQCGGRSVSESHFCSHCGYDVSAIEPVAGDPYEGLVLADKYVIEDLIGEGAMGRVYTAKQITLGKNFAAKILAPHLLNDEASHARFASEAHNAASLNHPNCVSVVDYGQTPDGITYIVMEFIKGDTLEHLITKDFPIARERIVDITLQILAALAEAHGLGILHRDLKPENILVQQLRTHGELAKVLDFGIAKLMEDQAQAGTGLTSQGMVCGTPEYMSPEQARGHKLDQRSDLYAVGCIMYQMLTGRPPFESASAVDVLHKHLHEEPVPPSQLLGNDPDPLEAVCLKALDKDANNRYSSATEFREELIAATSTVDAGTIQCTSCGASMREEHRFCPACGAAAPPPGQAPGRSGRRHRSTRGSGLTLPRMGEPTAEVVVRNFPLPLAGREHVLQRARTLLTSPQSGVRVRVLAGPRGIGKTRLGDEVASLAESLGWRSYYVGADPSGAQTPLWPIQCMVSHLLGLEPTTVSTQDLGRVANLTGMSFEVLPGLAELFQLQGPAYDLEIGVRRRECFSSALQALVTGGRGQPLLLIFDDVDRFDTPSREILGRIANAQAQNPVFVLCTSAEPNLEWLGGTIEQLDALSPEIVEQLGRQVTMEVSPQSQLPEALAKVAPLSPLKLESHLRLLAGGLQAAGTASDRELLRTRFGEFGNTARKVLECGSILGERFIEQDLIDLLEADGGDGRAPDLDGALRKLHVGGMLLVIGHGERAFSQGLLHELVYSSIPEPRRRKLHALAANSSRVARASQTVRALHFLRSKHVAAYKELAEAGKRAERAFDDPAATEFVRASLAHLDEQVEQDLPLESMLCVMAARVMRSDAASREATGLIEGRLKGSSFAPQFQAKMLTGLGQVYSRIGEFSKAIDVLKKALGPAMAAGDRETMAATYEELGRAYAQSSDFGKALAELREGLDMFTLGEGPRAQLDFPIWRYLLRMCDYSRHADVLSDARKWCEHALFHAERTSDRLGLLRCHAHMAWVLRDLNQLALAEQHLARALDEARHFGDRLTTAQLLIERARARAARGRLDEARRCCEEALRLAQGIQWSAGVEHAERAIAMLSRNEDPPPTSPSEHSGRFMAQQ
ncbi:MAG: protein kinase [Myxococcota bacterium]